MNTFATITFEDVKKEPELFMELVKHNIRTQEALGTCRKLRKCYLNGEMSVSEYMNSLIKVMQGI